MGEAPAIRAPIEKSTIVDNWRLSAASLLMMAQKRGQILDRLPAAWCDCKKSPAKGVRS
jgi:hypothetical protein